MSIELTTYPGLDERIVILRAGRVVDAVFVRTERFNVLVDTLDTPESCRTALDLLGGAVGDRPLVVVNSHMDWDHFWGNAAVADKAVIVAHDCARLRFRAPATRRRLQQKAEEDARFAKVELCPPTLTFSDTLRLDGGDLTLELFPTPGHTPDHIAVWIPELRVCLAIDAVERPIPRVWSDDPADLRRLMDSLRRIQRLEAEHVVLAHGHTSSPDIAAQNLAYFDTLAARVARLGREMRLDASSLPDGLRLEGLVDLGGLPPEERSFYDGFHWSNLQATLRSHREPTTSGPSQTV